MTDFSTRSACVIDNGLFCEFAVRLAKDFGTVYLWTPWESAFPQTNKLLVGTGLEGVTKVESIWPIINKVDLFVFPDVGYGPLQEYLVSIGKRVFGSRMGEEIESFRVFSKKLCEKVGLPIGRYSVLKGMKALRAYLQENENQYIKISRTRGDFETFKSETYKLVEPRLDEITSKLGAKQEITEFISEDEILDAVEVGYDGFCIDGSYPTQAMSGIEIKSQGYVGHFKKYADMPAPLHEVNEKLSYPLMDYKYRNFWCAEARITRDGKPWVIDPCCRAGSPPSEVALMMYTNLSDIMWWGAEGVVVEPTMAAEWAAEIMVGSDFAAEHWQPVDFPPELRDNVKLYFPVMINERYYTVPVGHYLPAIGAAVAVGATMQEAMDNCVKVAEQIHGYYVEAHVTAMKDAKDQIAKLEEFGFEL